MRTTISVVALVSLFAVAAIGEQAASQPLAGNASPAMARVGTMSELMVHIIYPTSDAVFYISSRTPTTDAEWAALQASTLTLAESANLLMMPGRTRAGQWNADSRMMLDAAWGAFKAAKARSLEGVEAVSDQLYESCVSCHKAYRPDYGKPKPPRSWPGRISER